MDYNSLKGSKGNAELEPTDKDMDAAASCSG